MLDLVAALLSVQTPLAEVLTVVAEESIGVLAHARARASSHFLSFDARGRPRPDADGVTLREALEGGLLDWAAGHAASD